MFVYLISFLWRARLLVRGADEIALEKKTTTCVISQDLILNIVSFFMGRTLLNSICYNLLLSEKSGWISVQTYDEIWTSNEVEIH